MKIYQEVNTFLEMCFRKIEAEAPVPDIVEIAGRKQLRYTGNHIETAIFQKLGRYISSLNAGLVLLKHGYTQELGVLFRTLDEFQEDITFLSIPLFENGQKSQAHERYITCFYQEEFDNPDSAFLSTQKRDMVSRQTIQAAISNEFQSLLNTHDSQKNMRTLSQAYSGYVHGSSIHLIEMIDGAPLRYFLQGMPNTYRHEEFIDNYWDYSYRGMITMMIASKALGFGNIYDDCIKFRVYFEKITGDTGQGDAKKLLRKMKTPSKK